ncbi:MAG: zinc ribbon domain-containing protein [Cyclobacteriaceae bacterium]
MKKKECPSCAMEIDENAKVCPICQYEFTEHSPGMKWVAILLIIVLLAFVLMYLF